jgi:hypothetical protein
VAEGCLVDMIICVADEVVFTRANLSNENPIVGGYIKVLGLKLPSAAKKMFPYQNS